MELLDQISDTHIMLRVEDDSVVILDSKIQPKIITIPSITPDNPLDTIIEGSELIHVDTQEKEIIIFKLNDDDRPSADVDTVLNNLAKIAKQGDEPGELDELTEPDEVDDPDELDKFEKLDKPKTKDASTDTHVCKVCNKSFLREGYLRKHEKRHKGLKNFDCKYCDMKFCDPSNLKRHVSSHMGGKPFECDVCSMNFARKSSLKDHKRIHTGEKPYQCQMCDKIFSRATSLKLHNRTHTGEMPYKCPSCSKVFSCSGNLKKHKYRYHGKGSDSENELE